MGGVYYDLGEKVKALEYFEQALPLRRAVEDRGGEACTLNNIGWMYRSIGEMVKALEYLEQALTLLRAVGDRWGESFTCYNIGMVYEDLGQLEKTVHYVSLCVELEEQIRHPNLESDKAKLARLQAKLKQS
jgi:tetratricopeptide (TPR) repeat protein